MDPLNIPFLDLEDRHCREVVDTGADGLALYCGHARKEGSSYCPYHHAQNYTPAAPVKSTFRFSVRAA